MMLTTHASGRPALADTRVGAKLQLGPQTRTKLELRPYACGFLAVFALLLVAGCGGKLNATSRGTAQAFVTFMQAGKYKDAALLWDYDAQARRDNENWDDIAVSQRTLIIDKLADEKADTMKLWFRQFAGDVKVAEVSESGDTAKATLEGGGVSGLDLVKVGEEWRIAGMN